MNKLKHLEDLLIPLYGQTQSAADYSNLQKEMLEIDRAFRTVEELYATAYTKIKVVEEKILCLKEAWRRKEAAFYTYVEEIS